MKKLSLAMVCGMVLVAAFCHSEPKVIKNVRVSVDGKKQYFDLFQSAAEDTLWYCGQTKPTVLIREAENLQIPEISLIRFQKKDIKDPQKLVEGAHFRMHLSLGADETAMEELRKKLPSGGKKPPVLSPVPFSALRLVLQKPDGKEVEMKAGQRSSQNVAFSTVLGRLDSDLLDALMKGNTGAKYTLFYNYRYLDPVLTGKPVSASADPRESSAQSSGSSPDRDLPGSRDFSTMEKEAEASVGWEKTGEGFIGFSRYSRTVQDKCVFIESAERWQNAYLTLPVLSFPAGISVEKIILDVALSHAGKKYQPQEFSWTPARGWRDSNGAPLVYGVFALGSLARLSPEELQKVNFAIRQTIETSQDEKLVSENACDMIEGYKPISDPLDLADILEFETGMLTWAPEDRSGLKRIEVSLTDGDWKSARIIRPEFSNGKVIAPPTSLWLIRQPSDADESVLAAEVFFIVSDGKQEKKVAWAKNGKNLRKELFALSAFFVDKDWSGK